MSLTHPVDHDVMSRKSCLFCQLPLAKSKEHVLPEWLLNHLGISDEAISPTHFTADGKVVSSRHHKLKNLVEGSICANCNTGWMSQLETEAKQILIPLMTGEREVVELKVDERVLLARWTCKTSYVLNSSSNYEPKVPPDHFGYMHKNVNSLPKSVAVVAQQHHGKSKFYWLQQQFSMSSGSHPYVSSQQEAHTLMKPTYKISLLLNKLLLLVAYWPWPEWSMILWPGIHIPMWPNKGPSGWYHQDPIPGGFPWDHSLEALTAFHQTLDIVRDDKTTSLPIKA